MLKLQVILVPPSAARREQRVYQQGQSGFPNQSLNSSPNLFNRGIGTSTPNTNNNNSQNYPNSSFNSQAPIPFERPSLRKFLHITSRTKSLLEVAHEISLRFEKLYPEEASLEILKLQDSQECDLDPDYIAGDVFDYDRAVRVLLNNELAPEYPVSNIEDVSNITATDASRPKRSGSPIFSSQLLPKKRRQNNRDSVWKGAAENSESRKSTPLSNQIYPDQTEDADVSSRDANRSLRNVSINAEDSAETSLPPPDEDDTRYLDPKKSKAPIATSPLPPSSKRITSGMLVAPEPQLKDVEDEVLEEKQINDDITQRIIPVKKSLEEKTAENITSQQNGKESSDEDSDEDLEDGQDILPPPSQIKKHTQQILEKPTVGNTSLSNTVTLEKPKEEPKPMAAPAKADNSTVVSPQKVDAVVPEPVNTSNVNSKEASPELQQSQNTSASNIIANVSKRADITSKDSFSDSDEDEDELKNEPEFTKDEIIKIFKSGRLPASVTKKFAQHNSQKPVPPKTVRAAALKAAEKMSIPVSSRSTSPPVNALEDSDEESELDDESDDESDDEPAQEGQQQSESEDSDDDSEDDDESDSSDENVDYFEKKKNASAAAAKAKAEAEAKPKVPVAASAPIKAAKQVGDAKAETLKSSQKAKSSQVETTEDKEPVGVKADEKAKAQKKTEDEDEDEEMVDALETPVKDTTDENKPLGADDKLESLSQSLKQIDAQSTQLKDLDKSVSAANLPPKPQPSQNLNYYYAKPGKERINVDDLPQEFPTKDVPGLQEVIDQLKDPKVSDNDFNELLRERRRLLYNARRRYLRKVKNEQKVLQSDSASANTTIASQAPSGLQAQKNQSTPSQPTKSSQGQSLSTKPSSTPSTKKAAVKRTNSKPSSQVSPSLGLSQDSIDYDISRLQDNESSENTRREYEKAKEALDRQRQESAEKTRKLNHTDVFKKAKYYDAKEPPKSQEFVNDSSDSGSGSGSGSDSDSDSGSDDDEDDEDDEDEDDDDDKNKKKPRIVNTPKGLSQPTNLRKTMAANKKLPDVQETASAPVTPISKKADQTPSKQPQTNAADGKAKGALKKPNSRYSLSSLSDLVSRGVPDVIDSLTPKSSRTKEVSQSSQKSKLNQPVESSDSSDDNDDDNSDTDDSSDDSSSDEELKGSQKYLNAKTAKNLIGSQKGKVRTSSAFKGLMKDAKKK